MHITVGDTSLVSKPRTSQETSAYLNISSSSSEYDNIMSQILSTDKMVTLIIW